MLGYGAVHTKTFCDRLMILEAHSFDDFVVLFRHTRSLLLLLGLPELHVRWGVVSPSKTYELFS